MALIKCPECDKEISDTVESCINCGYRLSGSESGDNSIKSYPLGKRKFGIVSGILYCLLAVFFLLVMFDINSEGLYIGSILIRFTNPGLEDISVSYTQQSPTTVFILCVLFSIFAVFGVLNIIGWYRITCPYCDKNNTMRRFTQSFRCPYCKKVSVRKNNALEVVKD